MTPSRRALLAAAAAATLAACAPERPATTPGRTRLRFATDWRAQAEHGGFYQALAAGLYDRAGLDVTIQPGGPGANVPQLLAAGAVELGMGSNGFIALNLAAESVPVRAVAAFFQRDPQVLLAHPDPALRSIADLRGRPFLIGDASVTAFWVWLKAKYGFTDAQVRKYTGSPAPFLADPRAVQQGYLTSEPYVIERETGLKPRVFLLADEGYPGYANMVLAPDALLASNPAAVRAFVAASAQGWIDYLTGDPAAADALILRDNPEQRPDILAQARTKMVSAGLVGTGAEVGRMTAARWSAFFTTVRDQGVYPPTLDHQRAYSLDLLPAPG